MRLTLLFNRKTGFNNGFGKIKGQPMGVYRMLLLCALLSGCAATQPEPSKPQRSYVLGAPICVAWVHPHIENSTADFQACKYNHLNDDNAIEQCMLKRGWRRKSNEAACNIKSYSYEQRQFCLKNSMRGGRADHRLMANCLSKYTPTPSAAINQNALRNLLAQCLAEKDQAKQERCLNQALNKR